jgi:hypothetical protein
MSSTQTIYEEYHRSSTSTQTANCTTPLINKEIMTEASLTRLIDMGDEIQWYRKWMDFVDGEDGFFYGIPCDARRVVKFNPLDKSLTEIGPDLGEGTLVYEPTPAASTVHLSTPITFSKSIRSKAQWKHSTISSYQRPVMTCGHQVHLQQIIISTTCLDVPVGL